MKNDDMSFPTLVILVMGAAYGAHALGVSDTAILLVIGGIWLLCGLWLIRGCFFTAEGRKWNTERPSVGTILGLIALAPIVQWDWAWDFMFPKKKEDGDDA